MMRAEKHQQPALNRAYSRYGIITFFASFIGGVGNAIREVIVQQQYASVSLLPPNYTIPALTAFIYAVFLIFMATTVAALLQLWFDEAK